MITKNSTSEEVLFLLHALFLVFQMLDQLIDHAH